MLSPFSTRIAGGERDGLPQIPTIDAVVVRVPLGILFDDRIKRLR